MFKASPLASEESNECAAEDAPHMCVLSAPGLRWVSGQLVAGVKGRPRRGSFCLLMWLNRTRACGPR